MTARTKKIIEIIGLVVGAIVVLFVLAIVLVFVFAKPPLGVFEPVVWRPEPGFRVDPAKIDAKAAETIRPFVQEGFKGPEDIAVDQAGAVYTGTSDGKIMRISAGQQKAGVFAEPGGRPLGLAFDAAGNLLVANQGIGLQSVAPDGKVTLLTNTANGQPIHFANDLVVAGNGIIYFSDSNQKYNPATLGDLPSFSLYDFLDGRPYGRLLQYDPKTAATTELLNGLYFPNGVAIPGDGQSVLVAESTRYRITRYWLAGPKSGTSDIWLENVPGILDGFTSTGDGRFLLPMYERSAALDNVILPYWLGRQLLARLPGLAGGGQRIGFILVISEDGRVLKQIKNITPSPATVALHGGRWILGTLSDGQIRTMPAQ